jgi:hypothetical protein
MFLETYDLLDVLWVSAKDVHESFSRGLTLELSRPATRWTGADPTTPPVHINGVAMTGSA